MSTVASPKYWAEPSVIGAREASLIEAQRSPLRSLSPYGALLLLTAIAPFVYAFYFLAIVNVAELETQHYTFIAMCTVANFLCGALATRSAVGTTSKRLEKAFLATIAVHIVILLLLLGFRLYYSRPITLSAFFVSFFMAVCMVMMTERCRPRRVGIVPHAFNQDLLAWVGPGASIIPSAAISPRNFDIVLMAFDGNADPAWAKFVSNAVLVGCNVRHVAQAIEDFQGRVLPEHFEVEHACANPNVGNYLRIKRLIDIGAAVILLPFAVPVAGVAALLIKRSMGGKVLFTQDRVGLGGEPFRMYKLRTMREALPDEGISATMVADPRITPLGKWLRRFRIDELPQLWNILKGDMSLIGPRPEQIGLTRNYGVRFPAFAYRHLLRPGLTGWAQVHCGYAANEVETLDKLSFDLYYAKYVSFGLDLRIAIRTFLVVLGGRKSR